jgi:predicted Zn-dependent protease
VVKVIVSVAIIACSFLLITTVAYTDGIPFVSDVFIGALPEEFSIELGKKVRNEVIYDNNIDEDKTDLINEYANKLDFPKGIKVYVLKSYEANAFATPGKYIFINTGLLNKLEEHTELAALLAHEYIHIEENHGLRSVGRSLGYEIFTHVFFSKNLKEEIMDKSNLLINMEYSRQFEKEADLKGLEFIRGKNIDPNGMLSLMKKLKKIEKQTESDSRLSTHPSTIDRIEYLEEEIKEMGKLPDLNHDPELEAIFERIRYRW